MMGTFRGAEAFNQALDWDTSVVTDMRVLTFNTAESFDQPLNWDTSKVESMCDAFNTAESFNETARWCTGHELMCRRSDYVQDVRRRQGVQLQRGVAPFAWDTFGELGDELWSTQMGRSPVPSCGNGRPLDWDTSSVTNRREARSTFADGRRLEPHLGHELR